MSELLSDPKDKSKVERCLVPMKDVKMQLPVEIGDYSDFYASIYHATNVGSMAPMTETWVAAVMESPMSPRT